MSFPVSPDADADVNPLDAGEAIKPAHAVLRQQIEEGSEQLDRPARGLFLSGVSAGLDIGFGPLMVVTVLAFDPAETTGSRLMGALAYAIGFVLVILGRSELFTEHTTLAVLPRLSKEATTWQVARLWGLVYSGNIIGTIGFAVLASPLGLELGLFDRDAVARTSGELLDHRTVVIFGSAIAAGWLMGLVSWLVGAARDTTGQMLVIVLVTGSIYFLGLHHSIAGSVEVLMGVFAAEVPVTSYLRFLALATAGNAVGGIVFVAVLKFSHITRPGRLRAGRAGASLLAVVVLAGSAACTHRSLARNTLRTTETVMEIHYEGMLANLAMMSRHPEALPNHVRLADGVVQVNDQAGFGRSGGFTTFGGSNFGIEALGPSGRRRVSEQWGTDAITDPERLYDLQTLYRTALGLSPLPLPSAIAYLRTEPGDGGSASDEESEEARHVPLAILLTDVPPPGWYHLGSKRDVPKGTRYVGRWNDRYAWVTPDGFAGLGRFTLTVLMVIKLQPGERGGRSSGLAVTAGD